MSEPITAGENGFCLCRFLTLSWAGPSRFSTFFIFKRGVGDDEELRRCPGDPVAGSGVCLSEFSPWSVNTTGHTPTSTLAQALGIQETIRPGLGVGIMTQLAEHLLSIWGALGLNPSPVEKGGRIPGSQPWIGRAVDLSLETPVGGAYKPSTI